MDEASDMLLTCDWSFSLMKEPLKRATYAELLEHPWLVEDQTREVDMVGWVAGAITAKDAAREVAKAALNGTTPTADSSAAAPPAV